MTFLSIGMALSAKDLVAPIRLPDQKCCELLLSGYQIKNVVSWTKKNTIHPVMNKQILQEEHLIIMIVDDRCKK
jgi:hypothetical protein